MAPGAGETASSPAFVGYYRVSTALQGRSGWGILAQRRSVAAFVRSKAGVLVGDYEEWEGGHKPPSGRPALAAAIEHAKTAGARLLVARIDRLARSVLVIANLLESGVDFVAVDLPEANRFNIHVLAATAEYERRLTGARVRDALAAYQARGGKLGFARLSPKKRAAVAAEGRQVLSARSEAFAAGIIPLIREMQEAGLGDIASITRALNRRRIPTMYGRGPWHEAVVTSLVRRADPNSTLVREGRHLEQAQAQMADLHAATAAQADARALALMPTIDAIRAEGITSWNAMARALDARGVPTARNRIRWSDSALKNIVIRGERLRG